MQKRNLKSLKANKKMIKKKVLQLREEKNLLTIFLITTRKRPELNLEEDFGNFEFPMVPKAI